MHSKKTILIVDDHKVNRQILVKILSSDYVIEQAENGQVALDVLHADPERISLVLLDIVMPVLDGYEVLRQMHEDAAMSKIPVIVASGQDAEDAEVKALSLGANDYVLKPYRPEIIKHRIANTLYLKETAAFVNSVQHDALTGVYRKDYFYLQVSKTLKNNPDKRYDLICCDVEYFKLVNDRYGVQLGDELLKHIAATMSEELEGYGFCGRLGSDEFACLVPHRDHYEKIHFSKHSDRINDFSDAVQFNVILKYGIYFIEDISTPVNIMCDRAILAKESIKGKYDTFFSCYDDNIRQRLLDEQMIVSDMKTALSEKQFHVYFQPKYDLKTEEIVGAEALVRWLHPTKGFLTPGSFVPLFEKNGFIADLDHYVWDVCCQQMREWSDRGIAIVPISVNISRVDIYDSTLPQKLLSSIQRYKLSPKDLHLEITESAYTENSEQLLNMVSRLKRLGFVIEMDDFGTGYSSLNMLSDLPIDILKLDMRFIQKEEKKSSDRSVLSFIISLAKWMNLQVVAEGIETKDQVELLKSLGCTYAQGFFYAKPMPTEQFGRQLAESMLEARCTDSRCDGSLSRGESVESKMLVSVDRNDVDHPLLREEYEGRYPVEVVRQLRQALSLLAGERTGVGAVVVSMPDSLSFAEVSELADACEKRAVPLLVIDDRDHPSAQEVMSLRIADYLSRPFGVRQFDLRLRNAMAYAKLERFEQEKDVHAAIIEMRKRAEHDALTGLLNRSEYGVRIDQFFYLNDDPEGIFVVLDVDNFKGVNDAFGHVVGDEVLNAVGDRIRYLFPETDTVARIGGDEFSFFVPYRLPYDQLADKMGKLCSRFQLSVENVEISCSAGVCYCPECGVSHKDLYRNADVALIAAKRHGKSDFEIFQAGMEIPESLVFEQATMQMLDQVSDALFVSDAITSEIVYINEAACRVIGKTRDICLGRRCYELFWDQCHRCDRCEAVAQYHNVFFEERTVLKDGVTPVLIKARTEYWDGRGVKVHYLKFDNFGQGRVCPSSEVK